MPRTRPAAPNWGGRGGLLALALVSVALRLLFSSGLVSPPDLQSIGQVAQAVAAHKAGTTSLPQMLQGLRADLGGLSNLAAYVPQLLAFYLLGITPLSLALVSLTLSLACLALVYALTLRLTRSETASLLASALWAFFPLEMFFASAAPQLELLLAVFLLAVWALLPAPRPRAVWLAGLAALCAVALLFVEPWLLLPLAAVALSLHLPARARRLHLPPAAIIVLAALILRAGWGGVGDAFIKFYSLLLHQPEMVIWLPLFIVAVTVVYTQQPKLSPMPMLWLGGAVFAGTLKFLASGRAEADLFTDGLFLTVALAAFFPLLGIFLSLPFKAKPAAPIAWLAILGLAVAGLGVLGRGEFMPSFAGLDWIGLHSIFILLTILAGLTFLAVLASPLLAKPPASQLKGRLGLVLLFMVAVSGLPFAWNRRAEFRHLPQSVQAALSAVQAQPEPLSVYLIAEEYEPYFQLQTAMRSWTRYATPAGVQVDVIGLDQAPEVQRGLVLAADDAAGLPATWTRLGAFGELGWPRLVLYRVFSSTEAQDALAAEDPLARYQASLALGDPCAALAAWQQATNTDQILTVPYISTWDCVQLGSSLVETMDLRERLSIQTYISFRDFPDASILGIYQPTLPIYDMRTTGVHVTLQPDTTYLYSIEVQTETPTAVLYWQAANQEDYQSLAAFPEWAQVSLLLRTPNWASPQDVFFSPVLFNHLDAVSVKNFQIAPLNLR